MTSRATRKARREVLEGKKERTKGGLTSNDIVLNKGRPVSKKKHEKHKREYEEEANHPLGYGSMRSAPSKHAPSMLTYPESL